MMENFLLQNIQNLKTNMCLKNFVLTKNSEEHEKVTIAEVCTVYHGIKHNQSYVSMSCNTYLNHLIFSDSKTCKKLLVVEPKLDLLLKMFCVLFLYQSICSILMKN